MKKLAEVSPNQQSRSREIVSTETGDNSTSSNGKATSVKGSPQIAVSSFTIPGFLSKAESAWRIVTAR